MSTLLRDLGEVDLDWVAAAEGEIFGPSAWSYQMLYEDFRYGTCRYRGVDVDGEPGAYAIYGWDGDFFHLYNLAVMPQRRRGGLARMLMDDFLSEAMRLGADDAWLEVAVNNAPALALYESYGFEPVRVRQRYYQPEGIDALVMRKVLKKVVNEG